MTAILLAALLATPAVSFDGAAHAVTFTATATGVSADEPLEFLFVTAASDRAYEALYVTDATMTELARAFDAAGIPRGRPVDASLCRFRPVGPRLTIEPSLGSLLLEGGKDPSLPLVWTGGVRDAKGLPVGETNMPASVVSLFDCNESLLTLDDALPQSDVYGRYKARAQLKKGERATFTVRWDGASATDARRVVFRSGELKATLEGLKGASAPIDLLAEFDARLTLGEAKAVAAALAVLDSRTVRVNGFVPGQFFYRAYLPLEKWRDRGERLSQPLEVRLDVAGKPAYTVVEEDWKVEGTDPKLTPRAVSAAEAAAFKGDTCFFFAPSATRIEVLYRLKPTLPKTIRNWYLYTED